MKSFGFSPEEQEQAVETFWGLRCIDLKFIFHNLSLLYLRMPQKASLVPLINEPIRVNLFSFMIRKRGIRSIPNKLLPNSAFPIALALRCRLGMAGSQTTNHQIDSHMCHLSAIPTNFCECGNDLYLTFVSLKSVEKYFHPNLEVTLFSSRGSSVEFAFS